MVIARPEADLQGRTGAVAKVPRLSSLPAAGAKEAEPMDGPVLVVDTSEINEGRLSALKDAMAELVAFVEQNEVRPLLYTVYFDTAGKRVTVVQLHPDSASMELHMKVAASRFGRFADLLTLRTMGIYGTPSERLLDQLRAKVRLLGEATLELHDLHAGFARLGYSQPTPVARGS